MSAKRRPRPPACCQFSIWTLDRIVCIQTDVERYHDTGNMWQESHHQSINRCDFLLKIKERVKRCCRSPDANFARHWYLTIFKSWALILAHFNLTWFEQTVDQRPRIHANFAQTGLFCRHGCPYVGSGAARTDMCIMQEIGGFEASISFAKNVCLLGFAFFLPYPCEGRTL